MLPLYVRRSKLWGTVFQKPLYIRRLEQSRCSAFLGADRLLADIMHMPSPDLLRPGRAFPWWRCQACVSSVRSFLGGLNVLAPFPSYLNRGSQCRLSRGDVPFSR